MIKRFVSSIMIMIIACASVLSLPVLAESDTADSHPLRLVDSADLLTDSQEESLRKKLDEISERQDFDVVIVTVAGTGGKTTEDYANDFYDYNGYGMGTNRDGVLLLVSKQADLDGNHRRISTRGYGITAFTNKGIDWIISNIKPKLESNENNEAFNDFADYADDFVTKAKDGHPFVPFNAGKKILISLAIGLVLAVIVIVVMISQLKSVHQKANASDYTKKGSMNVTQSRDMFIYRHVDRRKKPENDSGSNTHTSSSGATHGGKSF